MGVILILAYNSVMSDSIYQRRRRSPKQVVQDLIAADQPADVAVYLSARIKACQAEADRFYQMCPQESRQLLDELIKH